MIIHETQNSTKTITFAKACNKTSILSRFDILCRSDPQASWRRQPIESIDAKIPDNTPPSQNVANK